MTNICWTDTADEAYLVILQSFYDISNTKALFLDDKLNALLERLSKFKNLCPPLDKIPGLRRCSITQNIGLVYDVSGTEITIISVFDSRSDHPFA
jgi:plasmid stabilization system protein ParE